MQVPQAIISRALFSGLNSWSIIFHNVLISDVDRLAIGQRNAHVIADTANDTTEVKEVGVATAIDSILITSHRLLLTAETEEWDTGYITIIKIFRKCLDQLNNIPHGFLSKNYPMQPYYPSLS